MADYTTNLKDWGSQGTAHPDGYSYLAGEQPVDVWDNFLTYNLITDVKHLISLTNDRFESDSGTARPTAPEVAHQFYDTDDDKLEVYTGTVWHRLLYADGDTMGGPLDMGGNPIEDATGTLTFGVTASAANGLSASGTVDLNGSNVRHDWTNRFEGGTVPAGDYVPLVQKNLADGEQLVVTQASLTEDGFTTPAPTGINLIIAGDSNTTSPHATILSGDGATLYDDETGTPVASYTNTTGAAETVIIALNNGSFGQTGVGAGQVAHGGFIARVV